MPGIEDVNDQSVEGWNKSAPPLYLWSHPDWTKKHKKVAEVTRSDEPLVKKRNISAEEKAKAACHVNLARSGEEKSTSCYVREESAHSHAAARRSPSSSA